MSATPPIPPSSNSGQVILQGVTSGGGTSGATNIPPGILALPDGTMVRGNIVHTDAHSGLATLRTPKGDMTLKSELPLARGHEVVIRLDTGSSGLKARIISVDGLTPKELASAHPRTAQNTEGVDDLIDLQTNIAGKTAAKPTGTPSAPLEVEDIIDIPLQDSVKISSLQTPILRAALLARSPQLPQLLQLLPKDVFISPQRLEAGATISLTVQTDSIELPQTATTIQSATTASPTQTATTPAAINTNAVLSALVNTPTATNATVAPATTIPNPLVSKTSAEETATPSPTTTNTTPSATPTGTARFITLPNGGYAPNPLLSAASGYTVTLNDPLIGSTISTPIGSTAAPTTAALPSALSNTTLTQPTATPTAITTPNPVTPTIATSPAAIAATVTPNVIPVQTPLSTPNTTSAPITPTPSSLPNTLVVTDPTTPITTPTPNTTAAFTPIAQPLGTQNTSPLLNTPTVQSPEALIAQGTLPAQVIGTEQSGETVLKTPFGTLKLDLMLPNGQRLALPPETTLNLQLISLQNNTATPNVALMGTATGTSLASASLTELSSQWSSLRDVVSVLQQTHPLIAQNLLQNIIPQAGPKMAKDVMFFLLGLKTGDAEDWLDKKTIEALEQQNRGDLVRKLSSEFGTLKQLFVDSPNPNWQAVFIPVHCQGEWQQTRLYVKKEKPESSQNKDDTAGTRFIMEVDLSRLGAMQFDGFVKKQAQSTLFDLVIRSAIALPNDDQRAIRDIFVSASELTGFKGGLNFQVGQPFPIQPLEELIKSDRNLIA